jgi:hypothetical protein
MVNSEVVFAAANFGIRGGFVNFNSTLKMDVYLFIQVLLFRGMSN